MDKKDVTNWKKAQLEVAEIKHSYKLTEIKAEAEAKMMVNKVYHENALEVLRIRSAEIRKSQDRKENSRFANSYSQSS